MARYANQTTITIKREILSSTGGFVAINFDNVAAASRDLKPSAFQLYIYLCNNKNDFNLDLSMADVMNVMGIKKTAYYDAIKNLKEKGYLVELGGNKLVFNEKPISSENELLSSENEQNFPENEQNFPENDRVINNIDNINITNIAKVADATSAKIEEQKKEIVEQKKEVKAKMSYVDFVRLMSNQEAKEKVKYVEDKIVKVPLGLREITGASAQEIKSVFEF